MDKKKIKYVFGPVPSRRLGHSLGIDTVPFKTCSYDCIYCQLGRTTKKTVERKEYVPFNIVINEIKSKLKNGCSPDYITLSGSGEPTLYSRIYQLINEIKQITDIPVAVLTNGSILWDKGVQRDISDADLVIPSLDAGDEVEFQCVNRSEKSITFKKMVNGLINFRQVYSGTIWLEIFILQGITAINKSIEKIAAYAEKINPDKIQLNTVVRPPAEDFALAVGEERMNYFSTMFGEKSEVIADYHTIHNENKFSITRDEVYNLLKRRPCSLKDISSGLSIHRNEAIKHIQQLVSDGLIAAEKTENDHFYKVK